MPTNGYFNQYDTSGEQELLDGLSVEAVQIHGQDFYYLPRTPGNPDKIYTEDPQAKFTDAYLVEMYIKSVDSFEGQGQFLTVFGEEVRDQITLSVPRTTFDNEVGQLSNKNRPLEGDVVFFPKNNRHFEIVYVQPYEMLYPFGSLYTWELRCQMFEYQAQHFTTGIPEIDSIEVNLSEDLFDWAWLNEDGTVLLGEDGSVSLLETYDAGMTADPLDDTDEFNIEAGGILDFTEIDPFSEGEYAGR